MRRTGWAGWIWPGEVSNACGGTQPPTSTRLDSVRPVNTERFNTAFIIILLARLRCAFCRPCAETVSPAGETGSVRNAATARVTVGKLARQDHPGRRRRDSARATPAPVVGWRRSGSPVIRLPAPASLTEASWMTWVPGAAAASQRWVCRACSATSMAARRGGSGGRSRTGPRSRVARRQATGPARRQRPAGPVPPRGRRSTMPSDAIPARARAPGAACRRRLRPPPDGPGSGVWVCPA